MSKFVGRPGESGLALCNSEPLLMAVTKRSGSMMRLSVIDAWVGVTFGCTKTAARMVTSVPYSGKTGFSSARPVMDFTWPVMSTMIRSKRSAWEAVGKVTCPPVCTRAPFTSTMPEATLIVHELPATERSQPLITQ